MWHVCYKHGDLARVLRATSRSRAKGRGCRTICRWLNARTATFFLSWSCLLGGDVVSCGLLSCCTGPEVYGADTWRLAGQWGVLVGNGPMGRTQIEIFRKCTPRRFLEGVGVAYNCYHTCNFGLLFALDCCVLHQVRDRRDGVLYNLPEESSCLPDFMTFTLLWLKGVFR